MRSTLAVLAVIAALALPAFGAVKAKPEAPAPSPRPAMVVLAYPGARPVMDVSLSDRDMLDSLKALLSVMTVKMEGNPLGDIVGQWNLGGLVKALEGLKELKVVQFAVPQTPDVTVDKINDFYAHQLYKENGWTRVFWRSEYPQEALAVYSQQKGSGLFVVYAIANSREVEMLVGRTYGAIDLSKVFEWVSKIISVETSTGPAVPTTAKKQ